MKSKEWKTEDRIKRAIGLMESALAEIEEAEAEEEKTRKEEIDDFFEKLERIRCPFTLNGEKNIMAIHFTDEAKENSEDIVLIAISKEKMRDVL